MFKTFENLISAVTLHSQKFISILSLYFISRLVYVLCNEKIWISKKTHRNFALNSLKCFIQQLILIDGNILENFRKAFYFILYLYYKPHYSAKIYLP